VRRSAHGAFVAHFGLPLHTFHGRYRSGLGSNTTGLDRDLEGSFDGVELAAGASPTDPSSHP
jgi:hypothetical protein